MMEYKLDGIHAHYLAGKLTRGRCALTVVVPNLGQWGKSIGGRASWAGGRPGKRSEIWQIELNAEMIRSDNLKHATWVWLHELGHIDLEHPRRPIYPTSGAQQAAGESFDDWLQRRENEADEWAKIAFEGLQGTGLLEQLFQPVKATATRGARVRRR